jgi:2-dehydropantoate 2-reductase
MTKQTPVLIVGTGAMACLFAAKLSGAGVPVLMSGTWRAGLQALRQEGVRLVDSQGNQQVFPVQVAEGGCGSRVCHALVLVKSWQTGRAARQLSECLEANGLALSLQNGLGNQERLVQALGPERVALGVTTAGATLLGPGRVRPAGEGSIVLGKHPRLAPLAELLGSAGFVIEESADTNSLLWSKLVINAAVNPLTALLNVPNGELLNRPAARALLAEAAREAATVATALDIQLSYQDPVAVCEAVAQRTAANRSSMLQDLQRGAPTEIDAICGAIVHAGEGAGIPTPINRTLWHLIKARVEGTATQP